MQEHDTCQPVFVFLCVISIPLLYQCLGERGKPIPLSLLCSFLLVKSEFISSACVAPAKSKARGKRNLFPLLPAHDNNNPQIVWRFGKPRDGDRRTRKQSRKPLLHAYSERGGKRCHLV